VKQENTVATVTKILTAIFLGTSIIISTIWRIESRFDDAKAYAQNQVSHHEKRPHVESISREEYRDDMNRIYVALKDINDKLLGISTRLSSK
jgi:hypothetical protein